MVVVVAAVVVVGLGVAVVVVVVRWWWCVRLARNVVPLVLVEHGFGGPIIP